MKKMWCIPPEQNAGFVAKMEGILDTYSLPYDENCPVTRIGGKPYQPLGGRREPMPVGQGKPGRIGNEYGRNGTCSVFVMCGPLKGWHHANARQRRTAVDFAHGTDWPLSGGPYKNAPKTKLVQDNPNTHVIAPLYKAFPAAKAGSLAKRLGMHYVPKHGSWLNIAEISISTLSKQCIGRRIPNLGMLNREIAAWETLYNPKCHAVKWQFTTDDARVKPLRLYPVF